MVVCLVEEWFVRLNVGLLCWMLVWLTGMLVERNAWLYAGLVDWNAGWLKCLVECCLSEMLGWMLVRLTGMLVERNTWLNARLVDWNASWLKSCAECWLAGWLLVILGSLSPATPSQPFRRQVALDGRVFIASLYLLLNAWLIEFTWASFYSLYIITLFFFNCSYDIIFLRCQLI